MEPEHTYLDVMVDIETTGTQPDLSAILQIAAVKFDPSAKKVDSNFFYKNLVMAEGRFWDEDTRHWWASQDPRVYEDVTKNPEQPVDVMTAFADWSGYNNGALRFWAKPTTFDFMFVSSYFKKYGITNPYSYRNAIDLNSFMQGRVNQMGRFDLPDIEFSGDAHNGIYDCLHQIKYAFAATSEGFTKP